MSEREAMKRWAHENCRDYDEADFWLSLYEELDEVFTLFYDTRPDEDGPDYWYRHYSLDAYAHAAPFSPFQFPIGVQVPR